MKEGPNFRDTVYLISMYIYKEKCQCYNSNIYSNFM